MSRVENFLAGIFFILCCIMSGLVFAFLDTVHYNGIMWFIISWAALIATPAFFCLGLWYGIKGLRQDQNL